MNAEELRRKLMNIFGEQITFNKIFDEYAQKIKNSEDTLLPWCMLLKEGKIRPIIPPKMDDGIVFIRKIGSSNRCIVIKVVNGQFREIHLGDHAYYDKLRNALGLKGGSY